MIVYIDNNVWDYFFKHQVDIPAFFPKGEFEFMITKEGWLEIEQLPVDRLDLKNYVKQNVGRSVFECSMFGFFDPSLPESEQRVSGFGIGHFTSLEENNFRNELRKKFGSQEKRKESQILFKQEADIELAVRSLQDVVLTFDTKKRTIKRSS